MIADALEHYKKYSGIHKDWDKAFETIQEWLSKPIPEGANVSVTSNGIKMVMQTYRTVPPESKKFEGHKRCVDIQFMVKGKETIYWAKSENMSVCVPYNEERDHMSFDHTENCSPLHLTENSFAVFFPTDGHKTQCEWDGPEDAVKIIVKLPL